MGPLERSFSDIASEISAPNRVDPSSTSAQLPSCKPVDKSVGGTLAATAISGLISWMLARWQNRTNRENYDQQVKDNISQWERENAYNSPSAMMSRFQEAGLNPDLIYGQSNESGHTQVAPEAPQSPNLAGIFSSVSQMQLNAQQQEAQIDLLRSQAEKNRSDVEHNTADIQQKWEQISQRNTEIGEMIKRNHFLNDLDLARKLQVYGEIDVQLKQMEKMAQDVNESVARELLFKSQANLVDSQKDLVDSQKKLTDKDIASYEERLRADLNLKRQQAYQAMKQAGLADKQAQWLQRQYDEAIASWSDRVSKLKAEVALVDKQGYYYMDLSNKIQKETEILSQQLITATVEAQLKGASLNSEGEVDWINPLNWMRLAFDIVPVSGALALPLKF